MTVQEYIVISFRRGNTAQSIDEGMYFISGKKNICHRGEGFLNSIPRVPLLFLIA